MNSKKPITMAAAVCGATLLLAACGGGGPSSSGESKLTDGKVVIGLLNDQSGVYKDLSGPNSKVAIEMAIDDYKKKYGDKAVAKDIEIVMADHQNKPDIANTKAQEMSDRDKADRARRRHSGQGQEEALHRRGCRDDRPHRQVVQQVHLPLGLRHLHARQRHRHRPRR